MELARHHPVQMENTSKSKQGLVKSALQVVVPVRAMMPGNASHACRIMNFPVTLPEGTVILVEEQIVLLTHASVSKISSMMKLCISAYR